MNGRTHEEQTPEGRLAAVARSLAIKMDDKYRKTGAGPREPDYADYREAFAPYVKRELLLARIDEARKTSAKALTCRMMELTVELAEVDKLIPREDRL
ncbi:MAG: hypothetical protein LAN84_00200 [Acidobacteriia bacterium]|nr:hypothetical protein [Terriglobia bacterium]